MPTTFLEKARAQNLSFDVSRAVAAVVTATGALYSPSGAELQAATTATKGPSTTFDGAAAAGQRTLPLTATTSISVGDVLWPLNAYGQTEPVVVAAITSGVSVTARHDLRYTYASSDACASRRLTLAVLAASIPTSYKGCRARWTYTGAGPQTYIEDQIVHVSTYAPRCTVTEIDVLRRLPQARTWTDPSQSVQDLVESIWSNEVLVDLAVAWGPTSIISGDSLHVATVHRVVAQLCLANGQLEQYDRWIEEYRQALAQAISDAPRDEDDDGSSEDEVATSLDAVILLRG